MEARVRSTIAEAEPKAGAKERVFAIADTAVRFRFATARLAALFEDSFAMPAERKSCEAWEVFVTAGDQGTPAPDLAADFRGGEILLHADAASYSLWMGRHAPALYAVDLARRRALYWVADTGAVPAWERSRPFLPILQVILDSTPWIAVHAAAISHRDRAVLFAGPGRAGKTSLALSGMKAGWRFAGDDHVLLRTDGAPAVAPLYATARLRDDMTPHFRSLTAACREISEESGDRRHELSFNLMPGAAAIAGAPLALILLLDRRGAPIPAFAAVSRTALLAALIANTAISTPGHGPARAAKLIRLLSFVTPLRFDPGPAFAPALDALARRIA